MKFYGGNFKNWMEDNYEDYIEASDFEIEDINYKKNEAKRLLFEAKSNIEKNGDIYFKRLLRTKLREGRFPKEHIPNLEDMKKLEVDLELMDKIVGFADDKNPKIELNYIHLNREYVEATNTKILIKHKHKYNFETKIFFPPYFIEPMKDGAECFIWKENTLFLKYKDEWFQGLDMYRDRVYPDVDRICSKDDFFDTCPFVENWSKNKKVVEIDDVTKINIRGKEYNFNKIYFDEIKKLDFDVVGTYSDKGSLPVFFKAEDFEIVAMPLFD